jgi:hypothetical protein
LDFNTDQAVPGVGRFSAGGRGVQLRGSHPDLHRHRAGGHPAAGGVLPRHPAPGGLHHPPYPLIFAIICYESAAVLGGMLRLIGIGATNPNFGWFLASIIVALILAGIGLFIGAGILHLLVMLIVGSRNAGFEATFRVVTYSAVTSLLSWVPFIGGILSLYGVYLSIVGIREINNNTTGKAAFVVLISATIIILLVLELIALMGCVFFFGTQQ